MTESNGLTAGNVALVTGASSGIGEAVAELLVERGCKTICAARRTGRLQALRERLGENCHPVELDVTDTASVDSLLQRLPQELRAIDILINNAGHDIGGRQRFDQGDVANMASVIETNVIGLVRVTHAVIRGMLERGRGDIVNIGSVNGIEVGPEAANYSASKFAVHGLSRGMRADYRGSGIRIIEILPGLTKTGFAEARWSGDEARAEEFYDAFPSVMEPMDVARSVLFALEQPAHVTIAELVVRTSA